jgi:hypothetical protein
MADLGAVENNSLLNVGLGEWQGAKGGKGRVPTAPCIPIEPGLI